MWAEQHVVKALGISRDQMRSARELMKEGRDFEGHGEVMLTPRGLARLLIVLKCATPAKEVAELAESIAQDASGVANGEGLVSSHSGDGAGGAGVAPGVEAGEKEAPIRGLSSGELLEVTRPTRNHQLVMAVVCAKPSLGEVRVRVRDNTNWTGGMLLRATHVDADLYEFEGPMPRSRGRW